MHKSSPLSSRARQVSAVSSADLSGQANRSTGSFVNDLEALLAIALFVILAAGIMALKPVVFTPLRH